MRWAAVVVAGGASRRFGEDKLAAPLGGVPLLVTTVHAVLGASPAPVLPVVVVGPPQGDLDGDPRVRLTVEQPPGSGPAAAVVAGAAACPQAEALVVVPGDAPFAAEAVPRLLGALATSRSGDAPDAAVAVDPGGRRQHLLFAVRWSGLAGVRAAPGASARSLLTGLSVREVAVTARQALDVDDRQALLRAAQELPGPG